LRASELLGGDIESRLQIAVFYLSEHLPLTNGLTQVNIDLTNSTNSPECELRYLFRSHRT
jgi:hypothetical protein